MFNMTEKADVPESSDLNLSNIQNEEQVNKMNVMLTFSPSLSRNILTGGN